MSALWYILKLFGFASWQGSYSPPDPKINPHLCLDMTYPPAQFDVDWSKETQVIVKKTTVSRKNTIFSKLARILHSNWPPKQLTPVSWYDLPTCKLWCWLIKGNSSYRKNKVWRPPAHRHPHSNNHVSVGRGTEPDIVPLLTPRRSPNQT